MIIIILLGLVNRKAANFLIAWATSKGEVMSLEEQLNFDLSLGKYSEVHVIIS